MKAISQIPNWHRYVIGFLIALAAVCTAVVTGTVTIPPEVAHVAPYAGLVLVFLTAFLPRVQTETGPGAPPILSPPPKPPMGTTLNLAPLAILIALLAIPSLESLVIFLVYAIVLCIILYVISIILNKFQIDPDIKKIVWLVIFVVVLIFILNLLGIVH